MHIYVEPLERVYIYTYFKGQPQVCGLWQLIPNSSENSRPTIMVGSK